MSRFFKSGGLGAALAIALCCGVACGQNEAATNAAQEQGAAGSKSAPASTFAAPTNAALLYYRAWMVMGDDAFKKIPAGFDDGGAVPDELAGALASAQPALDTIEKASALESADWGVEYDDGVNALLPHLGKIRQTSRLLAADARRLIVGGQSDKAAGRVAAMFGLARHCTGDRVLISSMVGAAVAGRAAQECQALFDSGKLSSADRAILRAGLNRFDERSGDPFNIVGGIRGERYVCLEMLKRQTRGQGKSAGEKVIELTAPFRSDGQQEPAASAVGRLHEVALKKEFEDAARYYDDAIAAWQSPDARNRIQDLNGKLSAGAYGSVAELICPSLANIYDSTRRALDAMKKVRENLEAADKADPPPAPAPG